MGYLPFQSYGEVCNDPGQSAADLRGTGPSSGKRRIGKPVGLRFDEAEDYLIGAGQSHFVGDALEKSRIGSEPLLPDLQVLDQGLFPPDGAVEFRDASGVVPVLDVLRPEETEECEGQQGRDHQPHSPIEDSAPGTGGDDGAQSGTPPPGR